MISAKEFVAATLDTATAIFPAAASHSEHLAAIKAAVTEHAIVSQLVKTLGIASGIRPFVVDQIVKVLRFLFFRHHVLNIMKQLDI